MSSTNINVGLLEGRNSSRVLKPPGGGHSQIFGAYEDEKPKQKIKHQNSSEINNCFQHEISKTELIEETAKEITKEIVEERLDNNENANGSAIDNKPVTPRARVPPGGYSSGFW